MEKVLNKDTSYYYFQDKYTEVCKADFPPDREYYSTGSCKRTVSGYVDEKPSTPQISENTDNCGKGSIIDIDNMILRESIEVPGTNFSLNYSSDRIESYKPNSEIKFTVQSFSSGITIDEVVVKVSDREFTYDYSTLTPGQDLVVNWDGKDSLGNYVHGAMAAITYVKTTPF